MGVDGGRLGDLGGRGRFFEGHKYMYVYYEIKKLEFGNYLLKVLDLEISPS